MIICVKNLKELTKLISDYSKVGEYKINIYKSITFIQLYISNEEVEFEIKNTILFTLVLKK